MTETPALDATHNHEHDYSELLSAVVLNFSVSTAGSHALFKTDATGLFDLYLDSLPAERQVHNCHACRRFIETYGALATVSDQGDLYPAIWWGGEVPDFYKSTFQALADRVKKARITSVFRSKDEVWGTPVTGEWSHMSVKAPAHLLYRGRALTPGQAMAASKESYRTVVTALGEFNPRLLDEALRILKADAVARAEKFVSPVQWLRDLHDRPKGRKGENLLWRAIAVAPEGYLHPRAAVTGSLLEDIAAGLPFEDIQRKFAAKMHPLQYQRPQAPPSAGNIRAAEALFEKMGLEPALHRRFARLEELPLIWRPKSAATEQASGGIFSHIAPKGPASPPLVDLPAQTMTWAKFSTSVLPGAEKIEMLVPNVGRFIAVTTAVHADAPPILKWDHPEERNPLAWYVYPNGSSAAQWELSPNMYVPVTGISPFPNMVGRHPLPSLSEGVILVLEGAVDTRTSSNALFPECLSAEVHAVRSTIEAYSHGARLSGVEEASACGYDVRKSAADVRLRAFVNGGWSDYRIDRWD